MSSTNLELSTEIQNNNAITNGSSIQPKEKTNTKSKSNYASASVYEQNSKFWISLIKMLNFMSRTKPPKIENSNGNQISCPAWDKINPIYIYQPLSYNNKYFACNMINPYI